jgi:hypothetical protein
VAQHDEVMTETGNNNRQVTAMCCITHFCVTSQNGVLGIIDIFIPPQ